MKKLLVILFFSCLIRGAAAEMRYVSLDICSDYYLRLFAPQKADIWLTKQAQDGYSLPLALPKNTKFHNNQLEAIYRLKPHKVFYTDLSFSALPKQLSSLGIKTQKWPWPIRREDLQKHHSTLGHYFENPQKAQNLNQRLAEPAYSPMDKTIALMSEGGFIVGGGTHYDLFFEHLGFKNYYTKSGYGQISLEALALNKPDLIATFGLNPRGYSLGKGFFDRRFFKKLDIPFIDISSFFLICPSVEMLQAAQKVREAAQ